MPSAGLVVTISNAGTTAKINLKNGQIYSLLRKDVEKNIDVETMWSGGAPGGDSSGNCGGQNSV